MNLLWLSDEGARAHPARDLAELLRRDDGFVWADLEQFDDECSRILADNFGIDTAEIADAGEQSIIPKVHPYGDHLVLVLHSLDEQGHLLQLDQFISNRFLVTIHDRFNKSVSIDTALRETREVAESLTSGRLHPSSPAELSHAIVLAIADRLERMLLQAAAAAGTLDRRMRENETGDPETFLEDLFKVRHDFVTIYNRAAQTREACTVARRIAPEELRERELFTDLQERFDRLLRLCEGERRFLQEVLEFYEHRTNTKMNFAMERLALIAAVVLPVNALAGIVGMNTIVNAETDPLVTAGLLVFMVMMAVAILWWSKRKGWW